MVTFGGVKVHKLAAKVHNLNIALTQDSQLNKGTQFEQQYWMAKKEYSLTLTTILMHHTHTKCHTLIWDGPAC